MKTAIVLTIFLFCEILGASKDLKREEFKCIEGVSYTENDCNDCFCSGPELGCTEMACLPHSGATDLKCEPGTAWKKDCNKCWCTKKYGTVCTDKKC